VTAPELSYSSEMTEPTYLREISEDAAIGSVARVYEGLRRVHGVSFVAFVYRALATEPGRLERIWAELEPNLTSPQAREAAAELASVSPGGVAAIPATSLAVTGLDVRRVAATLGAFRRVNSGNLVAVLSLLQGIDRPAAAFAASPGGQQAGEPTLPIPEMPAFPEPVRALLAEMSIPFAGDERPVLIPSLLRALATTPALLALLWAALRPAVTSDAFRPAVDRVGERAAKLARELPYRVTRLEDGATREILTRFAPTIPAMLVGGAMMEAALAEVLAGS
jgi:hypothetical protein